jgi:hypothetical protein
MGKFRFAQYAIALVVAVAVVWVNFFLSIRVSEQAVPTLVNGITSSMSVIVRERKSRKERLCTVRGMGNV